ncbi:hypothetical protein ZWY2020_010873 [Hordeum vulgare]|nr:hypothetical protein ZWY2020_010873 [Hordeum vulgare]
MAVATILLPLWWSPPPSRQAPRRYKRPRRGHRTNGFGPGAVAPHLPRADEQGTRSLAGARAPTSAGALGLANDASNGVAPGTHLQSPTLSTSEKNRRSGVAFIEHGRSPSSSRSGRWS